MSRTLALVYGIIAYVVFLPTFLYAIGFVGDLVVPLTIDRGGTQGSVAAAVVTDLLLLGAFAVQHSVMARQGFKRWWTRFVPPVIERSTFVLIASVLLILLYVLWRPIPDPVWTVHNDVGRFVLHALFWIGWAVVFLSTFLIDHFELFGLKQVVMHYRGREVRPPEFKTVGLYRYVRHPLMLGFVLAFWATPEMTAGHLLFAATTTVYILIALQIEERDLLAFHGEDYRRYRREVSMLVPLPKKARSG